MDLINGVAIIIALIFVCLLKRYQKIKKLKIFLENIFAVKRSYSFANFTLIFYIFTISYQMTDRILRMDFMSLFVVFPVAIGFIALYRLVIKFYP